MLLIFVGLLCLLLHLINASPPFGTKYNLIDTAPKCYISYCSNYGKPGTMNSIHPNSEERTQHLFHNIARLWPNVYIQSKIGKYVFGSWGEQTVYDINSKNCGIAYNEPTWWYSDANQLARWKQWDYNTCSNPPSNPHDTCMDNCDLFPLNDCSFGDRADAFCNEDDAWCGSEGIWAANVGYTDGHCGAVFNPDNKYQGIGFWPNMNGAAIVYVSNLESYDYPIPMGTHYDERIKINQDDYNEDDKHLVFMVEWYGDAIDEEAINVYLLYNNSLHEMIDNHFGDSLSGIYSINQFIPNECEPYSFIIITNKNNIYRLPEDRSYYFGTSWISWDYWVPEFECNENHYYLNDNKWIVNSGPGINTNDIEINQNECQGCSKIESLVIVENIIYGENNEGIIISLPTSCGELYSFDYIHNKESHRKYSIYLPVIFCDPNELILFVNEYTNWINFDINNDKISLPILLGFHGYNEYPSTYFNRWGFTDFIEKYGIITVLPQGGGDDRDLSWNGIECCGDNRNENIDDINFIYNLLIDIIYSLSNKYTFLDLNINNINTFNLLITGMSNGGYLADLIGWNKLYDIPITSIVPVSGYIYDNTQLSGSTPINIMYIHGIDDITVNIDGCGCLSILKSDHQCCCEIGEYANGLCVSLSRAYYRWILYNQCDTNINKIDLYNDATLCVYATLNDNNCNALTAICLIENVKHDIYNYGNIFNEIKNEIWLFFMRSLCIKQGGKWNNTNGQCICPQIDNNNNIRLLYCTQLTPSPSKSPSIKKLTPRPTRKNIFRFPGNNI